MDKMYRVVQTISAISAMKNVSCFVYFYFYFFFYFVSLPFHHHRSAYLQPLAEIRRDHVHQTQLGKCGVLGQAETFAVEKYKMHLGRDQQQPGTRCNRPERAGSYFRPNLQSRKYQRASAKSHSAESQTKAPVLLRLVGNKDFIVRVHGRLNAIR